MQPFTCTFLFHLFFSPECTGRKLCFGQLWEKLPTLNPDTKTAEQTENSQIFLAQKAFKKHVQVENLVPAQLKISIMEFQLKGEVIFSNHFQETAF